MEYPMFPCACCADLEELDSIHIMWVPMQVNGRAHDMNHIIPLIPLGGTAFSSGCYSLLDCSILGRVGNQSGSQAMPASAKSVSYNRCIMNRYNQCALSLDGDPNDPTSTEGIEWLACDSCGSWYHSVCVGFCQQYCDTQPFHCMCNAAPNEHDV